MTEEPRRIVVLLHENDKTSEQRPFVLWGVAQAWRRRGIEVIAVHGTERFVDADLVVNHVDLTVVPETYRDVLARYPAGINRQAVDISKSKISKQVVRRGDGYEGPVIVKTVLNHGGKPEGKLIGLDASALAKARASWGRLRAPRVPAALAGVGRTGRRLAPGAYPVLPSVADVPASVWENPGLLVERFLPEREGDLYVVRTLTFLGDRHVSLRVGGTDPLVKAATASLREEVPPHPAAWAAAEALGVRFGKVDYAVRDGEAVVFDVNRTPSYGANVTPQRLETACALLADGLTAAVDRNA